MNDVNLIELAKLEKERSKANETKVSINLELSLLEEDQIFGDSALEIFKKYGRKAQITDFAILLGGYVDNDNYSIEGNALENRVGYYWTRTDDEYNDVRVISYCGYSGCYNVNSRVRIYSYRATLPYSFIPSILRIKREERYGLLEVEYGEYPQKAVDENLQKTLENKYSSGKLNKTGKTYTTDSRKWDQYDESFKAQTHTEYEYNGKKYIRVKANSNFDDSNKFTLSNGEQYKNGDYVWVEVLPIKWLVDEEADIAITKDIIFAGVQFNKEGIYKSDFENTTIYWFLNEIFLKDILSTDIISFNNNFNFQKIESLEDLKKDAEEAKKRMNEILEGTNIKTSRKTFTKKL